MITLGISAFYHDSAAALVRDGRVVAAAQEERFTRKKGDASFPAKSIEYCLAEAGVALKDVDYVGFYDKPLLTFDRLLETYLAYAPRGFGSFVTSIPVWVREKILQKRTIYRELDKMSQGALAEDRILFDFHHHSHASSAFYPSPFETAAVLVVDGVGEWATTSLGHGKGVDLNLFNEIRFPHSIGMLYSAFTYYLGFKINDGEYKVMGLAPYGEPRYADKIYADLIDLRDDGSFHLNMEYFNYCIGLTMTNGHFDDLFGGPPRNPAAALTQRDMDLARSIQVVTEEVMLTLCRRLAQETGESNLCLAGGVALNCVANGRILREGPVRQYLDSARLGGCRGIAGASPCRFRTLLATYRVPVPQDRPHQAQSVYLGPSFDAAEVRSTLDGGGATLPGAR